MVKIKSTSDSEQLEEILHRLCKQYGFKLYITGWTRKTYDIFLEGARLSKSEHLVRLESLATTNGEIHFFDERALEFAKDLAAELEQAFTISEATIVHGKRPEY